MEIKSGIVVMNEEERRRVSGVLKAVTSKGLINDDCPSIDVFDKAKVYQ
jgi:hypothetical protein